MIKWFVEAPCRYNSRAKGYLEMRSALSFGAFNSFYVRHRDFDCLQKYVAAPLIQFFA
jgi:hypothetical protein